VKGEGSGMRSIEWRHRHEITGL